MAPLEMETASWTLAFARASAFAATAPIAGSRSVPAVVRAALAIALTPILASKGAGGGDQHVAAASLVVREAGVGAAFGVAAAVVAAAASAGGGLIDAALAVRVFGREPVFGSADGPFSRLYGIAFGWFFLASGGFTHLCARLSNASSAVPLGVSDANALAVLHASVDAALWLAAPAIAGQLVATIAAGAAARAAPRINGLMLASPLTTCVILLGALFGAARAIPALVEIAAETSRARPL